MDRNYPLFASPKSIKSGISANSLAQAFALLYEGAAIHILKNLAEHRSISTTAAYLEISTSQLKAAVELV